jgi:two-component system, NtrC family, response regulator PilR
MAMVHGGRFREDPYYRLSAVNIPIPALRERTGDVERLAAHFLQSDAEQYGKPCPALAPETLAMLTRYPWPGNVRELENVIKSAALLAEDIILPDHLPIRLQAASPAANGEGDDRTRLQPTHSGYGFCLSISSPLREDHISRKGGDCTWHRSIPS